MNEIQKAMKDFVADRGWNDAHTPRNLLLALQEEIGELASEFVWADSPAKIEKILSTRKNEIAHEIADVLSYLVSFSSSLNIDIEDAFFSKLEINKKRFPVEMTNADVEKYRTKKKEQK